jgi:hypothetical protein
LNGLNHPESGCAALNPSLLFSFSTKFKLPTAIASDHHRTFGVHLCSSLFHTFHHKVAFQLFQLFEELKPKSNLPDVVRYMLNFEPGSLNRRIAARAASGS